MHNRVLIFFDSIILIMLTTIFSTGLATDVQQDIKAVGAKIRVISQNANNIYAAGANVSIEGKVNEDIWVAGAIVDIEVDTDGDLHAAGARVNLNGTVNGTARIAGADLKIDAVIEESLNAAAASIVISENTKLDDESSLAAALIEFHGTAHDDLKLYADEVVFSGHANNSITIEARNVRLEETARIEGDLIIRSSEEPVISSSAAVAGKVTQTGFEDSEFFKDKEDEFDGRGFFILLSTSIFLLGLILVLFTRSFTEQAITTLRLKPGRSFLSGLLVFFGVPFFVFIAMISFIGIPIGVATLLLLPFLLILGLTTTSLGISDWLLNKKNEAKKTGQRLLLLLVGVILLIVIGVIPFIGGLLIFIALLLGLGATAVTFISRLSDKSKEAIA